MNGVAPEQRVVRKRALTEELVAIRTQKADVLRQIEQIAKRQKTGGLPTKASELLAGNNKLVLQMEQRNRAEKMWVDCGKILQDLLKNQQTKTYFGEPVKESYVHNYYAVIKNPMDLGTVKAKNENRLYKTIYELRDDVRLTFNNCRIFNPPGNHVRAIGDQSSERFEKKWAMSALEYHWEAHIKQCALEDAQLEAESKSLPDKLQEVTAELQELTRKVEAHGTAQPPGPGREMTFEEKRKLSHSMGSLAGERLVHVLQIIAEGPSAPVLDDEDEYELDIDALDPVTCWKLQSYVDSVLAEQAAKQPGQAPPPTQPAAAAAAAAAAPAAAPGAAAAGAAAAGNGAQQAAAGGGGAAQAADGRPAATSAGSDSDEGVGSKGGAGSTLVDQAEAKQRRVNDLTTFVSATGPGVQSQILKNAAQKKDVQLQNAGAWANLTAAAPAAAGGAAQAAAPAAAAGGEGVPVEDDNLWTEFQGREAQQLQAEEAKKAAEEAERRRKEEEREAMLREAQEAEARKQREAEAKAEAERAAREEKRQREVAQFQSMAAAAEAGKDPDILGGGGATGRGEEADLADLGLQAKDELSDDEDVPMEDI